MGVVVGLGVGALVFVIEVFPNDSDLYLGSCFIAGEVKW